MKTNQMELRTKKLVKNSNGGVTFIPSIPQKNQYFFKKPVEIRAPPHPSHLLEGKEKPFFYECISSKENSKDSFPSPFTLILRSQGIDTI